MKCDKPDKPEIQEIKMKKKIRSSTSQLPEKKLFRVGKFEYKDVEKMKSSNTATFQMKFGRETEAAHQMHSNRDRAAGFPCDENLRENASP